MKIGVMGNIGVGKTTLCRLLKKYYDEKGLNFNIEYECQDENPYMTDYYNDMKKWAFACQLYFLQKKFDIDLKIANRTDNWIVDRIIEEDVFVFAGVQHDIGNIDDRDWQNYVDVYELMKPHTSDYDIVVYLYSSIENITDNIIKRGRDYEQKIDVGYIGQLNNKYEEVANRLESKGVNIVKVYVEGLDFEHDEDDFDYVIEKIQEKLK